MNIIITGASKGIGREVAKVFLKKGDNRIIVISRDKKRLDLLVKECENLNEFTEVIPMAVDLNKISSTQIADKIRSHFANLDILINNAGLLLNSSFEKISQDDIEKIFQTNLFTPIRLIKALIPLLKKSEHAHVVNITSMGGVQGSVKFPGLSIYSSSKAALNVLTECLAEEYKDTRIAFNSLALGAVQTEMLEEAFPGYKAPLSAYKMGEYIVDFAIKGHSFFNGKIIPVSISTP